MAETPKKRLTYLIDGSTFNRDILARGLRALDVLTDLVLVSFSETDTPLDPEPGQAWFIEKTAVLDTGRTATVDDYWTQQFGANPRTDDLIVYWGIVVAATTTNPVDTYGWRGVPIQESAYGYVEDQGGRYQWNGTSWDLQEKVQTLTFRQPWDSSNPPTAPGSSYYQIAIAPFDMSVSAATILLQGGTPVTSEGAGLYPPAIIPGIYYSTDNTAAFPGSWTTLVEPNVSQPGGWFATSAESFANVAHNGFGVNAKSGAAIFSTTIPEGAYIAMGGWDIASTPDSTFGDATEIPELFETQIRIDYTNA